jgi:hypothetical protein
MNTLPDILTGIIVEHMPGPLPRPVTALAEHIAELQGDGVLAVLAYGSCLRGVGLEDSLIDYCVLTSGHAAVSPNPLSRLACRLVPPNVYYAEAEIDGRTYRAKYAILPLGQFARKVSRHTANPYFWARFVQPCAIALAADDQTRTRVLTTLATACRTAYSRFRSLTGVTDDPLEPWLRGFVLTYGTELRPEPSGRAAQIVSANEGYYLAIGNALDGDPSAVTLPPPGPAARIVGKLLSACRLIKAAFTFQGGADYLAWKISRHSGQPIELTAWQRNHPLLAAITLLPRLLKSGAIR